MYTVSYFNFSIYRMTVKKKIRGRGGIVILNILYSSPSIKLEIENITLKSNYSVYIPLITSTISFPYHPNSHLQNVRSFWTEGYKNPWFRNQGKHFKDLSPELLQCVPYFFVIGFPKCGMRNHGFIWPVASALFIMKYL